MILPPSALRVLSIGMIWAGLVAGFESQVRAESTYHVSPQGNDGHDGKSPATPWRTVARVNAHAFEPGDQIRFERDGEWRESLVASSSGAPGRPIVFGSYGTGTMPKFWGSELLDRTRFEPATKGAFQVAVAQTVHAVLVNQVFLRSSRLVLNDSDPARNHGHVQSHPGSWFLDGGVLHVNTGGVDPRIDPRTYSVVVRDDVVASNGKDHLIFRDLVVDESARFDAGYGFRIMGSADVRLDTCASYRAGKHHFGVINSTGFVGVGLLATDAMPDQGAGGASAFVSYSDRTRSGDTSEYHQCVARRLDDPGTGGRYPAFVTHGEGVGSVLLHRFISRGGDIALGNDESGARLTIHAGRLDDAKLLLHGREIVVDGMTILGGSAGVHLDGARNTLQNLLIIDTNPGFAGHQAAITEGGRDNLIRFCTVVMDPASPDFNAVLSLKRHNSRLRWHGNVMMSTGTAVRAWFPGFDPREFDASMNFYGRNARFDTRFAGGGTLATLESWQALGLDRSSLQGDPRFADRDNGGYAPRGGSPLIDAVSLDSGLADGVRADILGRPRPQGKAHDIGAFEGPRP